MKRARPRLLVAEDDDDLRYLIASALSAAGFDVVQCRHGVELLCELDEPTGAPPVGIVTDIRMPGVSGLSILEGLRSFTRDIPVVVISGYAGDQIRARESELGVIRVFDKPFDIDELVAVFAARPGARTIDG